MGNILIVYYSRTGFTGRVAKEIATATGAESEALCEPTDRKGFFHYLRSGHEALAGRLTPIRPTVHDPAVFDLVILGTPVWAGRMSSPMRTYMSKHRRAFRRLAFFCTQHASGADKVFRGMAALAGKEPVATLALNDRAIRTGDHKGEIVRFVEQLGTMKSP
jgi:flavodoxin